MKSELRATMALVKKLGADASNLADAMALHTEQHLGKAEHAALHRLERIIRDMHVALAPAELLSTTL